MSSEVRGRVYVGGSLFRSGIGSVPGWGIRTRGDRIEAVLPDEVLRREARAEEVVELGGGLLSPGFVDAHYHPTVGGVEAGRCDLSEAASLEECLTLIAEYASAHPDVPWILGGGWSMDFFPGGLPHREQLDAVTGGRPASLANRDHHGYWVNSEALRRAGVTAATPDPVGGRIERDADGSPSGTLHEAAGDLVNALKPVISDEELAEGLLRGEQLALRFGITGWQDALVGQSSVGPDSFEAYLRAAEAGSMRVRLNLALWWDRDRGLEQIDDLIARRREVGERAPGVIARSVKLMVDGVAENFTAAVSQPYLDHAGHGTHNCGHSFIDPAQLKSIVQMLDAEGFQAHFHALGDRAVTEALDAIEHARTTNGRSDQRHHLAHLQMILIRDTQRFAELDATANVQALWAQAEPQMLELTMPFLDESLRDRQYPFGDLLRSGARLAAGSDWPVSSANPLEAMQVAVTRRYLEGDGPALTPEQSLTLEQIWTAYTRNSAWVNHREHDTGSLDVGKLADLAILDRDPFIGAAEEISAARVTETIIGGETVYRAE